MNKIEVKNRCRSCGNCDFPLELPADLAWCKVFSRTVEPDSVVMNCPGYVFPRIRLNFGRKSGRTFARVMKDLLRAMAETREKEKAPPNETPRQIDCPAVQYEFTSSALPLRGKCAGLTTRLCCPECGSTELPKAEYDEHGYRCIFVCSECGYRETSPGTWNADPRYFVRMCSCGTKLPPQYYAGNAVKGHVIRSVMCPSCMEGVFRRVSEEENPYTERLELMKGWNFHVRETGRSK